ncbi:hypothetical protein KKF84_08625 [Myxococcota bacterium]|nr:hypothetical protein [Myxococcota bacterium]
MEKNVILVILVFSFSACSGKTTQNRDVGPVKVHPSTEKSIPAAQQQGKQTPALIQAGCTGFPMGEIKNYNHRIRLITNKEGFVRVRKTPVWSSADTSNVIGTLKSGAVIAAWGPVKNRPSQGIGYIVPLVDTQGKTCRGYISQTMVQSVICNHFKTEHLFKAFPQALDTIPGPCPQ